MQWPATIEEAREIQERHRPLLRTMPLPAEPCLIAGVDASFSRYRVFAAACLYRYPELVLVEQQTAVHRPDFPYVPGYLFFREGPAIIAALGKLKQCPDVVLIDGQGIAHPRGIGSASHIGLIMDIPTIGCAKTRLVGKFQEPEKQKGSWSLLEYNGRTTGAVVRTQDGIKPVFLSPGHKIDLNDAIRVLLHCIGRYRIPEPLRCAHICSRKALITDGRL